MGEEKKKQYSQWIVNTLLSLLLIAYGVIFGTVMKRIDGADAKIILVEGKADANTELFIGINRSLGKIEGFITSLGEK